MRTVFHGVLLLVLAAICLPTQAAQHPTAEFPFEYREGLIWVKMQVRESSRPLNLLLDTGANVSVINLATARELGIKLGQQVSVEGVSAAAVGYWPEHLSSAASSIKLPQDFLAVDLCELSRGSECVVDGLLGADFFADHVVRIDFAGKKIQLLPASRLAGQERVVPLQNDHGALHVPIRVNGSAEKWVRLDTGCNAALHWVSGEIQEGTTTSEMAVALTKTSIPFTQTTVQIGGAKFENMPTGLHKEEMFSGEAGLLGNGLLSRFSAVTIDVHADRIILEEYENSTPTSWGGKR